MVGGTNHEDRTAEERTAVARQIVFGRDRLSDIGHALVRSVDFQEAVIEGASPDDLVARIARRGCDHFAELALYRQYASMIESIGVRFGHYPAFGPDDGHQEGVRALLEMARNGAADFTRRVKRALTNRVATEASRHSRALTGFSRDQIRTVTRALDDADGDHNAAREAVVHHPDVNRRMRADTFDAIVTVLQPTQPVDESAEQDADAAGAPDDPTAAYVADLLSHEALADQDVDLLYRAYGLFGYEPHNDDALGQHLGVDRSVAGKLRRRALATLRTASREMEAA